MKDLKLSNFEKFINIIIDEKSKVIENNFSPSWFVLYQIINDLFDLLIQHIKSIITLYKNDKISFCSACVIARTIIETYSYIVFILQPEDNYHKIIRLYYYIGEATENDIKGFKNNMTQNLTDHEIEERDEYSKEINQVIDEIPLSNRELNISCDSLNRFKNQINESFEEIKTNGEMINKPIIEKTILLKNIIIEYYPTIEEDSKEYLNNMKHNIGLKDKEKTIIPNITKIIKVYIDENNNINLFEFYMSFSKFVHSGFTSTISIENEYKDFYWRNTLLISYYTLNKVSGFFFKNFHENCNLENIIDESLIEELKKEFKLLSDRQRA